MSELRDYQTEAIDKLREALRNGKRRPVLQSPTGSGKTKIAAAVVNMARAKGKRVCFSVPALALIDQTVERFYEDGIGGIGVMQSKHIMTNPDMPVQIASVQTLQNRDYPECDLVIVDECHVVFKHYAKWMADKPELPFIGLSATPWTKGLGQHYDDLIIATTTQELIDRGELSPFKVYAPSHPDLRKVAIDAKSDDYVVGQLSEAMDKAPLVADVVETWVRLGENRPTLVFGVDRAHAKHLQQQFLEAGINAAYQDMRTGDADRRSIKRLFATGEYPVVVNVGTLCLDQETEILTDTGWVGIDAMSYGHRVAAWREDGTEFTFPLHIVKRYREPHEAMVSVDGRVHNIRVTGNHRMLWSSSPRGFKIATARDIVGRVGFLPVTGSAPPSVFDRLATSEKTKRRRKASLTYKYRKQGMAALQAIAAEEEYRTHLEQHCTMRLPDELSLDECRFIGFWIGDGSKSGGRYTAAQSCRYPKIIGWVDGLCARLRLHVDRRRYPPAQKSTFDSIRWNFSTGRGGRSQRVEGGIAPLIPYLEKDGSDLLWGLNQEQFGALLNGYWMADGNHGDGSGEGRGHRISGRSKKLFDLLQAIGACRGYRVSVRPDNAKNRKTPFWRMTWLRQSASKMVRQRFVLETDYRVERVWCVTSTTGNIITRRRGKVAVVGNTTGVDWDVRCIVLARPTRSEILYTQIIGRGLRTADGKDHCKILDHSDTTLRLGFVTDINHDRLDDGNKGDAAPRKAPLPKECPQCHFLRPPRVSQCPSCGYKAQAPQNQVFNEDGELVEYTARDRPKAVNGHRLNGNSVSIAGHHVPKREFFAELRGYGESHGYRPGWALNQYREKVGDWPPKWWNTDEVMTPSPEVASWIKSRLIKFSKSRNRIHG